MRFRKKEVLAIAALFVSPLPGRTSVEYRKVEKDGFLIHHYICRHPADLSKGYDPAYVQLNLGHDVRHFATADVAATVAAHRPSVFDTKRLVLPATRQC